MLPARRRFREVRRSRVLRNLQPWLRGHRAFQDS